MLQSYLISTSLLILLLESFFLLYCLLYSCSPICLYVQNMLTCAWSVSVLYLLAWHFPILFVTLWFWQNSILFLTLHLSIVRVKKITPNLFDLTWVGWSVQYHIKALLKQDIVLPPSHLLLGIDFNKYLNECRQNVFSQYCSPHHDNHLTNSQSVYLFFSIFSFFLMLHFISETTLLFFFQLSTCINQDRKLITACH